MNKPIKQPQKSIGFKKAIDRMRMPGPRLIRMRAEGAKEGFAHYVVPGGYVEADVAQKIKDHPQVRASHDGLFPGHDQTWRLGAND